MKSTPNNILASELYKHKILNKDGTISAYGLACGYLQIYHYGIDGSLSVTLERRSSLGRYALTVRTTTRIIHDSFTTVAEARERYNHWCKQLPQMGGYPSCP